LKKNKISNFKSFKKLLNIKDPLNFGNWFYAHVISRINSNLDLNIDIYKSGEAFEIITKIILLCLLKA
jgi:hypothetical protein